MRTATILLPCLAAAALLSSGGCAPEPSAAAEPPAAAAPAAAAAPRSVILLIGDGMGPQQLALLMDWADAAKSSPTAFERLVAAGSIGMLRTGAQGTPLTDSASSGTALSAGVEVPNGFIAMDAAGEPTRTCLEDAQLTGRMTGLVTTTRLTHATPAAFAAHVPRRDMEQEIGRQLVERSGVDVMLGGGAHFLDLDAARAGYRVVTTRAEMLDAPVDGRRLLGAFTDSHIPYAIDRDTEGDGTSPTLAEMTRKALDVLGADPDGFFLMVEGGRIDHGGHLNDVGAVLGEMREFDDAIAAAEEYRAAHPDTLVVVTADHETGGLGISSAGGPLLPRHFLAMAKQECSIEAAAPPPAQRERVDPAVFGVGRAGFYPEYARWETSRALARSAEYSCSYSTQGHTTTPVVVAAAGPGAAAFAGLFPNEHVGRLLCGWMQTASGAESDR